MAVYYIRNMEASELRVFFRHIEEDFPLGEYPPYEVLASQMSNKLQDGLVYCHGKQDLAYSICAVGTDHVLLSLFAVLPEFRGQGVGTAFLNILKDKYACVSQGVSQGESGDGSLTQIIVKIIMV